MSREAVQVETRSSRTESFLRRALLPTALLAALVAACSSSDEENAGPEPGTELLGGQTTVFDVSRSAFAFPARNLDDAARNAFSLGDHFFNRNWVTAPASISGNDGLGPTYNATSCSACHFKDGRGAPPTQAGERFLGLLVRLSVPGTDAHGGPANEPVYGGQFNPLGILGVPAEGDVAVQYDEVPGQYADGEPYSLRRPTYVFSNLAFGPLSPDVLTSPRVAPSMIGLGLLEAIPEDVVRGMADADDRDGDGISGRPNDVWNIRQGRATLGRFGWKANQPTVEQQVAGAFLGDLGITSSIDPEENCPPAQEACRNAPSGGEPGAPELSDQKLTAVTAYSLTLAVPSRRNWMDAKVQRGEKLFAEAKCASCHVPKIQTGDLPGYPAVSRQTIRPFTDLLLHDMGPELADNRPDFAATGTEWRTAPLWGVGLVKSVNKHTFLLHDGRARGFAEAVLWHGGEAAAARDAFRAMPKADREALLAFLEDL
ncbi:di-heme oxidoredictase family protein [Labilithrix luteola]|uniref:di-heme oxidoreductase family protein n=1 Tax=Labilithrix luteola TaxID=1391654 RepID=UPI000AF72C75|nr:di-heme oxidoredictase family protein [Labilithrix luteola]